MIDHNESFPSQVISLREEAVKSEDWDLMTLCDEALEAEPREVCVNACKKLIKKEEAIEE